MSASSTDLKWLTQKIRNYEHKIEEMEVTLSKKQEELKQHKKRRDDAVKLGEKDIAFVLMCETIALEERTNMLQQVLEEYQAIVACMKVLQVASVNADELERKITYDQDDYVIVNYPEP